MFSFIPKAYLKLLYERSAVIKTNVVEKMATIPYINVGTFLFEDKDISK
jgi:hypothetical protein